MNLFGMMDVSGSALKAERVRAEVVASNMANAETSRTADGTPYQRHHVVFASNDSTSFGQSMLSQMTGMSAGGVTPMASLPGMMTLTSGAGSDAASVPGGVSVTGVITDKSAPLRRFEPQNPEADKDGYVQYPDISPLTEMVDLMGASRAYGLNASAVQAEKGMVSASLDIAK
ncbi:MAG: flagellar basal body rod protein FlgC [Acidobacteriota bacterium]|nr:flagellar basal body rod protein FlgC [Acidobacteriota bacterium]